MLSNCSHGLSQNRCQTPDGVRPKEVRVIYRDEQGYSQVKRAADVPGVQEFVDAGATMGHLWMEGHLGLGDPLVNAGGPKKKGGR